MARPDPQPRSDHARQDDASGGTSIPRGPLIHVATRCTSIDEFVEKFATFASEGALVLPASGDLAVGTEGRFAILLRDRSVAMRGRCRVTDAKPAPQGANGSGVHRTMLRVALLEMDDATRAVHTRLLAAQRPPVPLPVAQANTDRTEVSPPREIVPPPIAVRPVVAPPPIAVRPVVAPPPIAVRPVVPPPVAMRPVVAPPVIAPPIVAPPVGRAPVVAPPAAKSPVVRAPTSTPAAGSPPAVSPSAASVPSTGRVSGAHPILTRSPVAVRAPSSPVVAPSPSRMRAPTLIGVAARPSTEGTKTEPARPSTAASKSADNSITIVPTPSRVETRVPGAAFTLPANPLSELGSDDLASFIDSTLFESEGEDAEIEALVEDDAGPTREVYPPEAVPPAARRPPAPSPHQPAASHRPAPSARGAAGAAPASPPGAGAALLARLPARVRTLAPRVAVSAAVALAVIAGALILRKPTARAPQVRVTAGATTETRPAPPVAAPPAVVPEIEAVPPPTAPVAKVAAPVAKAAAPVAKAAAPVAKAAPPVAAPAPREAPAPPEAPPAATTETRPARAVAAATDGACSARVITEPPDARVFWGDKLLGSTPLSEARVPCGPATITFRRDRYQSATREVSAEPGAVAAVSQRLHRPAATLVVGSSPPHGEITVNGQTQGPAPRRIDVARFETATIQVSLPGYATWKKSVYVRAPETHIGMQLVPNAHGDSARRSGAH